MRPLPIVLLVAVTAVVAGCGGGSSGSSAAVGTPEHPLVATIQVAPPTPGVPDATAKASGKSGTSTKSGTASKSATPAGADPGFSEAADGGSAKAPDAGPSYEKLLAQQSSTPQSRFTPCNLVTRAEAATIIAGAVRPLTEAPQGPTCIYRSQRTQHGRQFITVAVQTTPFAPVRREIKDATAVTVGGRSGVCGTWGQPSLYVPLSKGRLLTITGHCDVARRFAAKAVPRLAS